MREPVEGWRLATDDGAGLAERDRVGNERVRERLRPRLLAAIAVLLLPACNFGMYRGGSTQGHAINGLYQVLFWFAIPIGALVYGLMLWSVFRYRRRRGDDGSKGTCWSGWELCTICSASGCAGSSFFHWLTAESSLATVMRS